MRRIAEVTERAYLSRVARKEIAMRLLMLLTLVCALLAACATPESSRKAAQNLRSTQHQPAD